MSAKNCLVIGYLKGGSPYVISPDKDAGGLFSKKEAQRVAAAHISDHIATHAKVVEVVMEVNQ